MCKFLAAGQSPYNMVPGAGTPGPMMSPGPNQDSMGYNMTMNGSDYTPSQVNNHVLRIFKTHSEFET